MILECKVNEAEQIGVFEEIYSNVKIVEGENNKLDLKAFIDDATINTISFKGFNKRYNKVYYDVFYKNEIAKGIYQILSETYKDDPFFNILPNFYSDLKGKLIGYYSSYQNTFYDKTIAPIKLLELDGVKVVEYGDLLKEINSSVNEGIYNIIDDNVENLNLSQEELDILKEDTITEKFLNECDKKAIEYILDSKDEYYLDYADYEIIKDNFKRYKVYFNDLMFIKALCNKEALINEEISKFINDFDNIKYMYLCIVKNEYINKYIRQRKSDTKLLKLSELLRALTDTTKQTLNITYTDNDITMNFKIEGTPHVIGYKEISPYRIINKNHRDLFKKNYNNSDIKLECIDKITYSKKVLYQK